MDALSKRDPEPDLVDMPQVNFAREEKRDGKHGKKGGHGKKEGGRKNHHKSHKSTTKGGKKKGGKKKSGKGHKSGKKGKKKGHKRDDECKLSSRVFDYNRLTYHCSASMPHHLHRLREEHFLDDLGTSPI